MTTTMAIWVCVTLFMTSLFLFRLVKFVIEHSRKSHFFEIGKESEEVWMPGDRLPSASDDEDDEF